MFAVMTNFRLKKNRLYRNYWKSSKNDVYDGFMHFWQSTFYYFIGGSL